MNRSVTVSALLVTSQLIMGNAVADPLSSPAYIQQAVGSFSGTSIPLMPVSNLIGPISAIADSLPPLGPQENLALVSQTGIGNMASISQTGGRHIALVQQSGAYNSATIQQAGTGHRAFASQAGTGNIAVIRQR